MAPSQRPLRKLVLHMMLTLDGCVSGPNGELDWLFATPDAARDRYVMELYKGMDAALVGRVTYESMAAYWPSAEKNMASKEGDREFARVMNSMTKYVFSKTLDRVGWSNCMLVNGDAAEEVVMLKAQPGRNMVLCGGLTTARSFMKLGLIDEYQLIVHPVVLGHGRRLFEGVEERQRLRLLGAKAMEAGVVALHYSIA
jgi:dihydrofolate reductase